MKISLLDCTLRDGGYINDWTFGEKVIRGIVRKLARTGVEYLEVGFIKGDTYDSNKAVFPNLECFGDMIRPKSEKMTYVGMLDMSAPVPKGRITPRSENSLDGIRVIFKKSKMDEAYEYCEYIKEQGYLLFVNFVGTDQYTDREFLDGLEKFNRLHPCAIAIVDSFGLISKKDFVRLVHIADNNLDPDVALCYHAHNNLQQALANAETLVDMNLQRSVILDACVYGMGRGAGNLNLELIAGYLNDYIGAAYQIAPMIEIMDEYLKPILSQRFWGYSMPFYLSAAHKCHPNYALYYSEKNTLSSKSLSELLSLISEEDKPLFSESKADKYYRTYQDDYVDDTKIREKIISSLKNQTLLILAPGKSLLRYRQEIQDFITQRKPVIFGVNVAAPYFDCDYLICTNEKRLNSIQIPKGTRLIITSNLKNLVDGALIINYTSYLSDNQLIADNPTMMLLRFFNIAGLTDVNLAGFDGYSSDVGENYFDDSLGLGTSLDVKLKKNVAISNEIKKLMNGNMSINFVTPSKYCEDEPAYGKNL